MRRPAGPATARMAVLLLGVAAASCGGAEDPASSSSPIDRRALDAALRSADELLGAGHLAEALVVVETAVDRAPGRWEAHELHGRALATLAADDAQAGRASLAAARRREAAAAYRRAAQLAAEAGSERADLWMAAGLALDQAGALADAAEAYRRAGEVDPDSPQAPLFEGQARLRLEELDAAAACFDAALRLRPEEPLALAGAAETLRRRGDVEGALLRLRQARSIDRESMLLRHAEARLLRLDGRPRDGLELLLAAGEESWSAPPFVEEVALGWAALGEPRRAAEAWERCFARHPVHWTAALGAAEAWLDAGDVVRADALLREAALAGAPEEELARVRRGFGVE